MAAAGADERTVEETDMSSSHAGAASPSSNAEQIRLPDGRILACCLYGPEDGTPVLFQYGTPGTMFLAPDRLRPLDDLGIRLVVPDRPGYDQSTRLPGRSVAAVADDVAFLADHLGWDRFAIWGASGGGPHALACAALVGNRITRCASAVSPAPFDADGLDWLAGMSPGNVEEFTRARSTGNPPTGRWSSSWPATLSQPPKAAAWPSQTATSWPNPTARPWPSGPAPPDTCSAPEPPTPAASTAASTTGSPSPARGASISPPSACPSPSGTGPTTLSAPAPTPTGSCATFLVRKQRKCPADTCSAGQASTASTAGSCKNPRANNESVSQRPLQHRLGHLRQQAIGPEQLHPLGLRVAQQLVNQLVINQRPTSRPIAVGSAGHR
jgi:pimeloyl-ACP methyl ester carboxylesterase